MVVGEMPQAVDLVVIGAGPGGYTAALDAAARGRSVWLIDAAGESGVGGVCLLEGCIPSKAMIELGSARHDHARRRELGIAGEATPTVDLAQFQRFKNTLIATLGSGVRADLAAAGVTVVTGRAVFTSPRSLRVEHDEAQSELFEFANAIIATGSRAVEIPALAADPRVVDAAGVLSLEVLPDTVLIIGGGYIGVELGTALAKLGATVTLVEAGARILPPMNERVAADVARGLRRLGVTVLVNTVAQLTDGVLHAVERDVSREIDADLVVVAVGRRPNTESLALDRAGISTTPTGHIVVDESLRATTLIAAIGDVVAGPGLAHKATAQASIAVDAVSGRAARWESLVPHVVFSDPEAASVGMSLADALAAGIDASEVVTPYNRLGKAHVLQATHGHHVMVVDRASGAILGAAITGAHATELISEMTLAIEAGLLVGDVTATVHPHPTLSEVAVLSEHIPRKKAEQ
ncbi:MAG: dihydrolipoyl dehydrogenase family protein [Rhodoglobus sp.]